MYVTPCFFGSERHVDASHLCPFTMIQDIFMDHNRMVGLKLPEFIMISGVTYFIFAFSVPHLSAMGTWFGISAFLTFVYVAIAMIVSITDGMDVAALKSLRCKSFSGSFTLRNREFPKGNTVFLLQAVLGRRTTMSLERNSRRFSMSWEQSQPSSLRITLACYLKFR